MGIQCTHVKVKKKIIWPACWGSLPMTAPSQIPCQTAVVWPFSECDFQDWQKYLNYTNHTLLPKENACQFQGSLLTFSFVCCSFQTSHLPSVTEAFTSESPFALSNTFHPLVTAAAIMHSHTQCSDAWVPFFTICSLSRHLMSSLWGPGIEIRWRNTMMNNVWASLAKKVEPSKWTTDITPSHHDE